MSDQKRRIQEFIEPVPESLTAGRSAREKEELARGHRALNRLREQERELSTQAKLRAAPEAGETHIPQQLLRRGENTTTILNSKNSTVHVQPVKVKIPKIFQTAFGQDDDDKKQSDQVGVPRNPQQQQHKIPGTARNSNNNETTAAAATQSLVPTAPPTARTNTSSAARQHQLANAAKLVEVKSKLTSVSERIGVLYNPTSNVRTTFRNDAMQSSEFYLSYRGPPPLPPARPDLKDSDRGVKGKDPLLSNFMALEDFDPETEFETKTPQEWIALGANQGGTRARSRWNLMAAARDIINKSSRSSPSPAAVAAGPSPSRNEQQETQPEQQLLPCRVLSFDEVTNSYTIQWEHHPCAIKTNVKRLNVVFDQEDEESWKERYEVACRLRNAYESQCRLDLFVDELPDELVSPLEEETVDRILGLVARDFPLKFLPVLDECIEDFRIAHKHGLKLAVHGYGFMHESERQRLHLLNLPYVERPPLPSLAGLNGIIDTPSPNFQTARHFIAQNLFSSHALLYEPIQIVWSRWKSFEQQFICDPKMKGVVLPCEVSAFNEVQQKAALFAATRLKDDWSVNTFSTMMNHLPEHFNFYEEDIDRFVVSRMFRFCQLINNIMNSQLRQLMIDSIAEYVKMIEQYRVILPDDFDAEEDFVDELPEDAAFRDYWDLKIQKNVERRSQTREKYLLQRQSDHEAAVRAAAARGEGESFAHGRSVHEASFIFAGGANQKQQQQQSSGGATKNQQHQVVTSQPQSDFDDDYASNESSSTIDHLDDLDFPIPASPRRPVSKRILEMTRSTNGNEPLFFVSLKCVSGHVVFSPSLEQLQHSVARVIENVFALTQEIRGIGDQSMFSMLPIPPIYLHPLDPNQDPAIDEARSRVHRALVENAQAPLQLQQLYSPYEYLLQTSPPDLARKFERRRPRPQVADYDSTLERLFTDKEAIRSRSLGEVTFELIHVDCREAQESLIATAQELADALMHQYANQLRDDVHAIADEYRSIDERCKFVPESPEELHKLKDDIDAVPMRLRDLDDKFRETSEGYQMLSKYGFDTDQSDFEQFWHTLGWPKAVATALEDSAFKYHQDRQKFQQELREDCDRLSEEINLLVSTVEKFGDYADEARADECYEKVRDIEEQLEKYQGLIAKYNSREAKFGTPLTQWSHIKEIRAQFEPYQVLWETVFRFNAAYERWMNNPLEDIRPDDVEQSVEEWRRRLNVVSKKIREEAPLNCCYRVKDALEKFKPYVPLIKAMRSNLQQNHYKQIGRLIGQADISPEGKTLNDYIKLGLLEHITQIQDIAEIAEKSYALQKQLDSMQEAWRRISLQLEPYGHDTYKLKSSDDIQQLLDDHTQRTQIILSSPYVKMAGKLEDHAKKWDRELNNIQNILDEWFKCQSTWSYLEPIFSAGDIAKALPNETLRFQSVDQSWRTIMQTTLSIHLVTQRCQEERLLNTFRDHNQTLEEVLKKLHQFLETKRMAFPRFYFISNEELIQILADSKDPYRVQPYLSKCFEGIKSIHFRDNLDIVAMESAMKEVVPFARKINPGDYQNAVESWLMAVEIVMCDSVRDHIKRAVTDYKTRPRTEFIRFWPGQIVLAVTQVYWTSEAAEALLVSGSEGLESFYEQCRQQLDEIVVLVRDKGLSPVERVNLEALVVLEVHALEVIRDLADKKVDSPHSFDWMTQLRYYWEENNELYVRQINASIHYGYEYIGNTSRLVITQLTDRCYRTLMGALHMSLGGAPEGPAGTGKTETVKDLAKAVAKMCVVYNCNDQMTVKDTAKLFKGLAQTGGWGCFDEFNRIEIQVLSVIAQQIATIQDAILARRLEFMFEDCLIKLKPGSAVFITMNPGYAGRAELPDNLKTLFRPVAMMVPNYAKIAEIQLYSYGFLHAKPLAEKIVATYKLCSEQLSSQDHYDYGMRAVKAVLTAAGRLKRLLPGMDENLIVLRSIQDVNIPKFLAQDVELFKGIVSDLFPSSTLPPPDYAKMSEALQAVCQESKLQATPYFLEKCFQTYEMIVVRHGMMLVGFSFGGKTSVLNALSKGLGVLAKQNLEERTRLTVMNPKAVTLAQLYGKLDISGEWSDGILAKAFRVASHDTSPDRKWLVLDGPVDAMWIENMNTVLDDNKRLCLQNGDIVPMSASMNMIFEVQDLASASPATVSRCGMVYVEPETLGWKDTLVASFKQAGLPEFVLANDTYMNVVSSLLDVYIAPLVTFLRRFTTPCIAQGASVSVASLLRLFGICLGPLRSNHPDFNKYRDLEQREIVTRIEGWFIFSLVWSLGGPLHNSDRQNFHRELSDLIIKSSGKYKLSVPIPSIDRRTLFDFRFESAASAKEPKFVDWMDSIGDFTIGPDEQYHEIIVPTLDTERYNYLMRTFVENLLPCLLVGDTGTGKTIMAKSLLMIKLQDKNLRGPDGKPLYIINMIQFSAQTSANQTQDLLESKTERRRKGTFGPAINKRLIVFVDDLNMPQPEEWSAQPPIELLRQFLDHGGWYNHTKDNVDFRRTEAMQLLCAMGPPGGGRNHITQRFTRHFNTIAVPSFDEVTLRRIFNTLIDWILSRGFAPSMKQISRSLVGATIALYQTLVDKLKPTPEKSHYTFNLRDLSKVFQGINMIVPSRVIEHNQMLALWVHEVSRVFADRLIDAADHAWFFTQVDTIMQKEFKNSLNSVLTSAFASSSSSSSSLPLFTSNAVALNPSSNIFHQQQQQSQSPPAATTAAVAVAPPPLLLFGDIANDARSYEPIESLEIAREALEQHVEAYNLNARGGTMDVVVFRYVIEHVTRICRILKQPFGNAMLIGVGGSGRTSCTKLAARIEDYSFFTVQLTKGFSRVDFWDSLKTLLLKCGKDGIPTVFMLNDTQIVQESFLEDVCNLLNAGEVPGLFAPDEIEAAANSLKGNKELGKDVGRDSLIAFFVQRCRVYLHVVLAFSPVGKTLRERLRKFPSLVNCSTIDWFGVWPVDGLRGVARRFLSRIEDLDETDASNSNSGSPAVSSPASAAAIAAATSGHNIDRSSAPDVYDSLSAAIADCFVEFHESTRELGVQYLEEMRQHTYVTPTSYLELLTTFKELLERKRSELRFLQKRYDDGLLQLQKTEQEVEVMTQELQIMQPQLARKAKETEELIDVITRESAEAEIIRSKVAIEEAAANATASKAKGIRDICDAKVREAQPKLDEAREAASNLDQDALREIRALAAPPQKVRFVIEALQNLLGGLYKPKPVRDSLGKVSVPYWEHAQRFLMTDKFKHILLSFDVTTATEEQIVNAKQYIAHKDFDPRGLEKASKALPGIARFVIASEAYYQLDRVVRPLKANLEVADKEYDVAMAKLKIKKEELQVVDDELQKKKDHLERVKRERKVLEDKVIDTDAKLRRAVQLTEGLGGEKIRYKAEAARYATEFQHVVGDVLISSAVIAYLGPFQQKYRQQAIAQWTASICAKKIPITMPFIFDKFLGNPIQLLEWQLKGLPSDTFSMDNAIILQHSRRYPLLVDPQQQASKWIRRIEQPNGLVVLRASDSDYPKQLAGAVRSGTPVLLENVGEDLDPVLENLLLKRIVREGSTYTVVIGEPVAWNDKFRLYITTKLPRPHYQPEVSTKVAVINFMITQSGLHDQLLQKTVFVERREIEEKKQQMTMESAATKSSLKKTEDTILALLSGDNNLLENEAAIAEINKAKMQAEKNHHRQTEIEAMEKQSDKTRSHYKPVALLGAQLFFVVQALANVDPMYSYSLQFYVALFHQALVESERGDDVAARIDSIKKTFLKSLYTKISRSLFSRDQLMFSFAVCLKIFDVDPVEIRWLLLGGFEQDTSGMPANPYASWLPQQNWKMIWRASTQLPVFSTLLHVLETHKDKFRVFCEVADPLHLPLPGLLDNSLTDSQRLLAIRMLRTDKVVPAVQNYVQHKIGGEYIEPPLVNLEQVTDEIASDATVPVVFVLSPGADPVAELTRIAELRGLVESKKFVRRSLGQGQDGPAIALMEEGRRLGHWVLLENCHVFADFMPTLANIVENYSREDNKEYLHREYRLWLTSLPSESFPVSILQNGVKLVLEPPTGLKNNLLRTYTSDPVADVKFYNASTKPDIFRKLLFGMCFFHSLIQERRSFGPLGWNIPYGFNDTDMKISVRQLQSFVNENSDVPYDAISYLTGQCNYGGRVTDDWDRRALGCLLNIFLNPEFLLDGYKFSASGEYFVPRKLDHESIIQYIRSLPLRPLPEIFGLHTNADITKDEREARQLMDTTLATQPRNAVSVSSSSSSSSSQSSASSSNIDPKTVVLLTAKSVVERMPVENFNVEQIQIKHPISYANSMNTVLIQELIRFNRLLKLVRESLVDLQAAIRGEVVMSAELEQLFNSIYDGKIPDMWKRRSYPSLKSFGSYINDLVERLKFLQRWIDEGPPAVFWISGFFFTQSFLTGVQQNYARRYKIEIDKLVWTFVVMTEESFATAPNDGCYIKGLFLEGAAWDAERGCLCESAPRQLFFNFPILFLLPAKAEDAEDIPHYPCPCYKTTDRRGVLSTTGHSTNFIMTIKLPRDEAVHDEAHWTKRGTALFTQLEH